MISEDALVIYKTKPALVKEIADGKFSISLADGSSVKVRDKDIELIHPGPVKNFSGIEAGGVSHAAIREAWELLSDEGAPVSLKDLAALVCGEYSPSSAYAAYFILMNSYFFSGNIGEIVPRDRDKVTAEETKREEKQRETAGREQFLERLKACLKKPSENPLPFSDLRFMQDVEALAYGRSTKSRTMKEMGLSKTPEDAHALLLNTGLWTAAVNPHPARFGLSLNHPDLCPGPPPSWEDRRDLCRLAAFAIDSPWSVDPDDAVSIETDETGGTTLYVHIADPASSISPGSPVEKDARDRGVTLYLPEDTVRMLADEALPLFALGLSEKSAALTFKMTLNEACEIIDTEIFPSIVKVTRITYEEVDREIDSADTHNAPVLRALYDFAMRNFKRRTAMGAVNIELPETHITVVDGTPDIKPIVPYRSTSLVRECMITAGEGAGSWAAEKGIAFPYISQEVDIQGEVPEGLAGSWFLRKCMRPRILSTKPGRHQGLGLDTYTQVTSPLRRYTDLLAHMQIRAFLRGDEPLSTDEVSARLGFCEAASAAAVQAERASNNHWTLVFLSGKKDSAWDAVALEKKGIRWAAIIPSLALETQTALQKDVSPNDNIKLILKSVNIPRGEAVFVQSLSV
jgi:exoribonuclease-2